MSSLGDMVPLNVHTFSGSWMGSLWMEVRGYVRIGVNAGVEIRRDPGVVGRVGPGPFLRDLHGGLGREEVEILVGPRSVPAGRP